MGISEFDLHCWMAQDDPDAGLGEAVSAKEREELAQVRRNNRRLEMEVEILKRASAHFARENALPK